MISLQGDRIPMNSRSERIALILRKWPKSIWKGKNDEYQ
jgi:hypothetical protein